MSYIQKAIGSCLLEKPGEKKIIIQDSGCKGPYALQRLSHHDCYLNTPVEPMHLVKNIGEPVVKLLSGVTDTLKVREEKQRNRFPEAWLPDSTEKEKNALPPAPFVLSKEE